MQVQKVKMSDQNLVAVEQPLIEDFLEGLDPKAVLKALFAASQDCIKILDLEGRLLFMSEGGQRAMEVSDFSVIHNRLWPDFWHGDGKAAAEEAIESARKGEPSCFKGFAETLQGNTRFWDVQVLPLGGEIGSPTHLLTMSRDVTELRSADSEIDRLLVDARENEARFHTLADTMPQMVWSTLPDGFHDYYNARWYEFTGMPNGSTDGEGWNDMFHPDDQALAWERWRTSLRTGDPYEIEYRLRHRSGQYRWVLGRALAMRDSEGQVVRWYGTCTDIHEAKQTADSLALMSHELSHRIKNIFAIVNGLIGLSARRFPESKQFAIDIQLRLAALGRAHDFARPHSDESRPIAGDTTLSELLRQILKPYPALDDGRISISGVEVVIDDRSATPLALIFHELATNASKYGALSTLDGRVEISVAVSVDTCAINWIEVGGPIIDDKPERQGFGTKLSTISAESQLGGNIDRRWLPSGLHLTLQCPVANLRRP